MVNVEREEEVVASYIETIDKEGTYEQKKGGDLGNKMIYGSSANVFTKKKVKVQQTEKVIFSD